MGNKIISNKLLKLKGKLEAQERMKEYQYWEKEVPEIIKQRNMEIHHYKKYGALQIKFTSKNQQGKAVVSQSINFRKYKLFEQPDSLSYLVDVLSDWQREYKEHQRI